MRANEEVSTIQRFAIPGAVVIALSATALIFWLRTPAGQITCEIAADLSFQHADEDGDEQIKEHLLDHFAKEPHLKVAFNSENVGKITGHQEFIGKRKRSKLGKKLTGESTVEVATPEEYETLLAQQISSLGQYLSPSNIGIHKVITDPNAVRTARANLLLTLGSELMPDDDALFLAKYTGSDPQSFAGKVASLPTGNGGRYVLGNQYELNREILAVFLVERESPIHSGHLEDIFQSEPEFAIDAERASPEFTFKFNEEGAKLLHDFTAKHVGHSAAIIINDFAQTVPMILSAISGGSMLLTMGQGSDDSLGHRLITSFRLARLGMSDISLAIANARVECK